VTIVEVDEHHHITHSISPQGPTGCLLFFDSHDDLGPPSRLLGASRLASLRRGTAASLESLDIGTWILPAVFSGRFSTILWVSAWTTNLPHASFTALVGPHNFEDCGPALAVACTPAVPAAWRALWADYCLPTSSLSQASLKAMVPFRVVHTDCAGAVRQLKQWQQAAATSSSSSSGGGAPSRKRRLSALGSAASAPAAAPPSPPLPTSYQCSIDLDFFSVRNPALRSIPWTEHPSFRRELIALARRVPMEHGAAFTDALEALASSQDTQAALGALLSCGLPPPPTPGAALTLRSLLATIAVRFSSDLHGRQHLRAVLCSLLLANLAEHESTEEELEALEAGCRLVLRAAYGGGGAAAIPPVLIARSELYTPRRQLADILGRARRLVAEL
jgi:hypothetical protein